MLVYNYFGIDGRLHATQRVDRSQSGAKGVWEEYRYDPLGRRILVRAVKEDLCEGSTFGGGQSFCQSTITRYVWAGDQILWEMRVAGEDTADLEKTAWSSGTPNAIRFGRVSYLHAGGIDRPLAIAKEAVGTVVPHQNWRGMFAWGTWGSGTNKGLRSDCLTAYQTGCMNLQWPGWQTSAHHKDGNPGEAEYWMGSLVDGMRDASGQIYMRNRYYDPATGQFTQTDPIGLAGGLNAYGFAAGDPVSYSDPYGLRIEFTGDRREGIRAWNEMVLNAIDDSRNGTGSRKEAADALLARLNEMWKANDVFYVEAGNDGRRGLGFEDELQPASMFTPQPHRSFLVHIDGDYGRRNRHSASVVLAHELGGSWGRWKGRGHAETAVETEDWYRTIVGCAHRVHHVNVGPTCRPGGAR